MSAKITPIRPDMAAAAAHEPGGSAEQGLAARLKAEALNAFTELLDRMFDGADDALFALSERAENLSRQGFYFDAMRSLRLQRTGITERFIPEMSTALSQGPEAIVVAPPTQEDALGLMPVDDLEQNVALAGMSSRAAGRLRQELTQLHARLDEVPDARGISVEGLAPAGLCQAFRAALEPAELDLETALIVLQLFEQSVLGRLGPAYHGLNQWLEEQGVVARAVRAPRPGGAGRRRQRDWASEFAAARSQIAPEHQFDTGELMGGLDRLPVGDADFDPEPEDLIDALMAMLRDAQGDSVPRGLQREQRRMLAMAAAMFRQLMADDQLGAVGRDMLARLRPPVLKTALIDPSFFRDVDHPARRLVNEVATLDELLADTSDAHGDARDRVDALLARFAREPGALEDVAKRLTEISATLSESQAQGGYDGHDEGPEEGKNGGHAGGHPARSPEAIERAKRRALLELRQQSLGRHLPEAMKPFLLKAWGPLMAYRSLNHGPSSAAWRDAGDVLTLLLDAVQPPRANADHEALRREHHELLALVRRELSALSMGRGRVAALLELLEKAFAEVAEQAGTAPASAEAEDAALMARLTSWIPQETVFDDSGGRDATSAAFDQALADAPAPAAGRAQAQTEPVTALGEPARNFLEITCRPGTWFQIHTGDRRLRWLQVKEYDGEAEILRFADRDGQIVYEKDALPFIHDLQARRTRPIYDRDAFDQALADMLRAAE